MRLKTAVCFTAYTHYFRLNDTVLKQGYSLILPNIYKLAILTVLHYIVGELMICMIS